MTSKTIIAPARRVDQALAQATARLTTPNPRLDAAVILSSLLKRSRAWLAAHGDYILTRSTQRRYRRATTRRSTGYPLAYITNQRSFFDLELGVSRAVLIPRPATEIIVDYIIPKINGDPRIKIVADIGTGSGAIALSIAEHCPRIRVVATDISLSALKVARANARRFGLTRRITFFHGNLAAPLTKQPPIDVMVANLPYLTKRQIRGSLRFEPRRALVGGPTGLAIIQRLLRQLKTHPPQFGLVLELQSVQCRAVAKIIQRQWPTMKTGRIKAGRTTVGICVWNS